MHTPIHSSSHRRSLLTTMVTETLRTCGRVRLIVVFIVLFFPLIVVATLTVMVVCAALLLFFLSFHFVPLLMKMFTSAQHSF
jgi:hypothetical protein